MEVLRIELHNVAQALTNLEVSYKLLVDWKAEIETVPTSSDIIIRCADNIGNTWCLLRYGIFVWFCLFRNILCL